MQTSFLTHFYFGDRQKTFHTGLGTVIRAKGHSMRVTVIAIDNSFSWLDKLEEIIDESVIIYDINDEKIDLENEFQARLNEFDNQICLIVNFDLLIEFQHITLESFLRIICNIKTSNELILTSEKFYKEIENIADYVSNISSN